MRFKTSKKALLKGFTSCDHRFDTNYFELMGGHRCSTWKGLYLVPTTAKTFQIKFQVICPLNALQMQFLKGGSRKIESWSQIIRPHLSRDFPRYSLFQDTFLRYIPRYFPRYFLIISAKTQTVRSPQQQTAYTVRGKGSSCPLRGRPLTHEHSKNKTYPYRRTQPKTRNSSSTSKEKRRLKCVRFISQ